MDMFILGINKFEVVNGIHNFAVLGYDMCVFTLEGQGFLWHQVRCVMGLLFLVGNGTESPQIIHQLLDIDKQPK